MKYLLIVICLLSCNNNIESNELLDFDKPKELLSMNELNVRVVTSRNATDITKNSHWSLSENTFSIEIDAPYDDHKHYYISLTSKPFSIANYKNFNFINV